MQVLPSAPLPARSDTRDVVRAIQFNSRPRVSGTFSPLRAAAPYAMPHARNAQDRPRVSPNRPTTHGARALSPRAKLYVKPKAVARIGVGKSSFPSVPEPAKNPVPKKAVMQPATRITMGPRAAAKNGTNSAPAPR